MEARQATATHKFQMNLATKNMGKPIANIRHKSIRNRILDAIFGKQNRVLIIVPDGCVDRITFTEDSGENAPGGETDV